MDSKSFEILKEMVKGRVVSLIMERGRGFSSWIRFGERGPAWILKGVEFSCDSYNSKPISLEWTERRRV